METQLPCKYFSVFTCIKLETLIYIHTYSLWMLPSMVLKKMVMGNFGNEQMDPDIADSVDFMVEKVLMIEIFKC